MTLLHAYKNGNVNVSLFADGTKTRVWEGEQRVAFPESIDLKVTNYCGVGCSYCHESSTAKESNRRGADRAALENLLAPLPAGIELAIGGGNPTDWPELSSFLWWANRKGFVCNITMHQHSLQDNFVKNYVLEMGAVMIRGIGISVHNDILLDRSADPDGRLFSDSNLEISPFLKDVLAASPNCVFHVIAGVHKYTIIEHLCEHIVSPKILVLGYKRHGFGKTVDEAMLAHKLRWFRYGIVKAMTYSHNRPQISFDNLAIEQLNIRGLLKPEAWDKHYMGPDFTTSMYVDAVQQVFAPTSTTTNKTPWKNTTLLEYFTQNKRT